MMSITNAETRITAEASSLSCSSLSLPLRNMSLMEQILTFLVPWTSAIVWPLMCTVPLVLSTPASPWHYTQIFRPEWYEYVPTEQPQQQHQQQQQQVDDSPPPLGLCLGIFAVAVGQFFVWVVFYFYKFGHLSYPQPQGQGQGQGQPPPPKAIQTKGARPYDFWEGLTTHLAQPGGFLLLAGYLAITWMLKLLPHSYYSFHGTIQWPETFACLVIQDGLQYIMHVLEHVVSPAFYQISHKPHHRFTNPRLFDAFDGSLLDTLCMIIIPLYATANIVRNCNVWTYMAFGSSYACWLTLIHSEYVFPWDSTFRALGFGTPADHHVHHKVFKFNYGHLFMWFDQIAGTYRDPKTFAPKVFNKGV